MIFTALTLQSLTPKSTKTLRKGRKSQVDELIGSALPQIFAAQRKHPPGTSRLKQYRERAGGSYFSQRKAVDQPPGFMQVFPAIVSYILHSVTVARQAACRVSKSRQSVKDYHNHRTATLYGTVNCITKRIKDQRER